MFRFHLASFSVSSVSGVVNSPPVNGFQKLNFIGTFVEGRDKGIFDRKIWK